MGQDEHGVTIRRSTLMVKTSRVSGASPPQAGIRPTGNLDAARTVSGTDGAWISIVTGMTEEGEGQKNVSTDSLY